MPMNIQLVDWILCKHLQRLLVGTYDRPQLHIFKKPVSSLQPLIINAFITTISTVYLYLWPRIGFGLVSVH